MSETTPATGPGKQAPRKGNAEATARRDAAATPAGAFCLRSLGGMQPNEQILEDWKRLQALPPRALESFYDLLKPSLGPGRARPQDLENQAQAYCQLYDVRPSNLSSALRSCGFLLTRASQLALPAESFRRDLESLCTDTPAVVDTLMQHYDEARGLIRQEMVQGSLFDHGKVLMGIDWRVDTIQASNHGADIGLPVALLTLRCQQGQPDAGNVERISVYAVPEVVRQLRMLAETLERQMTPSRGRHVTREELQEGDPEPSGS